MRGRGATTEELLADLERARQEDTYAETYAEAPTLVCSSVEQVLDVLERLREQGYQNPCPYDDLGSARIAIIVSRAIEDKAQAPVDERVVLAFYPLGKLDVEKETTRSLLDFWTFLSEDGTYPCDNPKKLTLGAVRYYPEESRSRLLTIRLADFMESVGSVPEQIRDSLRTLEGRSMGRSLPFSEESQRIREALAV